MLDRIERELPLLSKTGRKVAAWVLAHPRIAADSTLAEVARATGVSEPSVIRFCRRVGLDGFRDLTLRLTEALSRPASYVHRDVDAGDSLPEAVGKVLDASIRTLVDTRANVGEFPIEQIVDQLGESRQIVFQGLGASGHVATDACHKFFRLGIPCSSLTDAPSMLQCAAIAGPGDVIVIVSAAGTWPDTARAAQSAAANGATVIALTAPGSGLADAATIVLPIRPTEDTSVYTPMSSRLAHLAVLDAILVSLALSLGPAASERLRISKNAISVRFSKQGSTAATI